MATEPDLPVNSDPLNQNRNYQASGGADEDRVSVRGATPLGKQNTSKAQNNSIIDERRKNPLGDFSSYTYQITLYMISPAAYNAYVESGRKNINAIGNRQTTGARASNVNEGVFIVAQSGGINRTENRAPYLDLDYYIDDLKIKTQIAGAATASQTNNFDIEFKIIEPYGFSFLTQLKLASETLKATASGIEGYKQIRNALKQFFILGIKFIGYDDKGNIVDPTTKLSGTSLQKNSIGGIQETFYDIAITRLNFKLDGRATVYDIKGKIQTSLIGFGIKFGRIDKNAEIEAENVETALNKLMERLNALQSTTKTNYKVVFKGDGIDSLKKAKFYSDADLNKLRTAMSVATRTNQANDAASIASIPKLTKKQFTINNSTAVLQQIDNIIIQSDYLAKALTIVYKANLQARQGINEESKLNLQEKKEVQWYHISADVKVLSFNAKLNDYEYEITYVIEPYKTPAITAAYIPETTPYYGPVKRYDYYFTGQNSEIISYTQEFNNTFFNVISDTELSPENYEKATLNGQVSLSYNKRQDQSRQGALDMARETQNGYLTSLVDPSAWVRAKITILGDPDFLMQESTSSVATAVYSQFYGPNYTVNANGGQVFIEINFKEAVDYDDKRKTGTLNVNDKILFVRYPKDIADKVQGIVFQVRQVNSTFSKGKFTQEIEANVPTFGLGVNQENRPLLEDENQTAVEVARLTRSAKTSSTQVINPPVNPSNPSVTQTTTAGANERTVPVNNRQPFSDARFSGSVSTNNPNPVRDDDAGGSPPSPFQVGA